MATEVEARLEARADNLAALDREALNKTTHGIAARIDKMPVGKWQKKLMWLFGGAIFIDSLDNYVGGGILAQLISEGWSTIDLNAWFTSMTMSAILSVIFIWFPRGSFWSKKSPFDQHHDLYACNGCCCICS